MFKKIITVFIYLGLSFGVFTEMKEYSSLDIAKDEASLNSKASSKILIGYLKTEHNESEDCDCNDSGDHCLNHCSGLHSFIFSESITVLSSTFLKEGKLHWPYSNNYGPPYFEPALRPPLFS